MNLYCWQHRENHRLKPGEVEQAFYALGAAHVDALMGPVDERAAAGDDYMTLLTCPLDALRWAQDIEVYAEHVEQGVTCRRDLERRAAP